MASQKFVGLAEISIIGTDVFKYEDKTAWRYLFTSTRVLDTNNPDTVDTERFYVWADCPDAAYLIAIGFVYRMVNSPIDPCIDNIGGGRYDAEIDTQTRVIEFDNYNDWYDAVN